MFKRILVTMDDSKTAKLALKKAIELAREQKAKLRIVHVVNYTTHAVGGEGINIDALRESMQKSAEHLLKKSAELAEKKKVKTEKKLIEFSAVIGTVSDEIIEDAKKWRASLIVIGTHGRRGMKRLILGSTAEEVLRKTTIPILLFRSKQDD
ncbi:universal stress protein [Aquicella lusitana]|uniref:Universal stress protein n=1 Tax=Aquicella lusitana TaxID=254246 RepID=A0A370GE41_9COXI|nr:universal stress protein [Aquicella lusitana]RDI42065.1 nucleotide-binding universal stress UspA family protein [Aquicella lusitana]VVC74428.1 Putative universal stress protein [Aquicella lusitana]